jgi:hypothetical protein
VKVGLLDNTRVMTLEADITGDTMSWKDIIKEEYNRGMPRPPKSRNIPMTCKNGHRFTSGEVKVTKKRGSTHLTGFINRCPKCGKKAKYV